MPLTVTSASALLEHRGVLRRHRTDFNEAVIGQARAALGEPLPPDLEEFYRCNIDTLGDFQAVRPEWRSAGSSADRDWQLKQLLKARAVPLFLDGCGSLFGLDLTQGANPPAVYFFDHVDQFERPAWAAGSSLAKFLLLLADQDRAHAEGWPPGWELAIDPAIGGCPRAPAAWESDQR